MSELLQGDRSKSFPSIHWEEGGVRRELPLDEEITIGRASDNRLTLDDQLVSRHHCVISKSPSGFAVLDLQSGNGTFVNDERVVGSRALKTGDRLKVGNFEMTFELEAPQPGVAYTASLSWEEGGQQQTHEVGEGLSIGRSAEADISTDDLQASRFHCRIEPDGDGFAVVDNESTNGTFLNGERVEGRASLKDGDVVRVGTISYQFQMVAHLVSGGVSIEEAQTIDLPVAPQVTQKAVPVAPAPSPHTPAAPPQAAPQPTPAPAVPKAERDVISVQPARQFETNEVIAVQNVIKEFDSPGGKVRVLKEVSLQVNSGEFVGVRGPSGSGKSTLLNMITGIDRPTSGDVIVANQSLNNLSENRMARWRGNHIGVIFQFFQLLPTLTVIENIMLPMDFCRKWKPRERQERAMALLEQVELGEHAFKLPSMLSGGQQQRAAIARALANDPPLIVADEPTGNLDSKTADRVFQLFQDLVNQGKTFLMVTHDTELATRIPRVLEVRDGELFEHQNPMGTQN